MCTGGSLIIITFILIIMKIHQFSASEEQYNRVPQNYRSPCCEDRRGWGHVIYYGAPNNRQQRYDPTPEQWNKKRWAESEEVTQSRPRPYRYYDRERNYNDYPRNTEQQYVNNYQNQNRRVALIFPHEHDNAQRNSKYKRYEDRDFTPWYRSGSSVRDDFRERRRENFHHEPVSFPHDKYPEYNKLSRNSSSRERYKPALLASYEKNNDYRELPHSQSPPEIIIHRVPKNHVRFPEEEKLHRFSVSTDKPIKLKIHRHYYKGVPVYIGKEDGSSEEKEYDPRFIALYRIVLDSYQKKENDLNNTLTTELPAARSTKDFHPSEPFNHFSEPDPLFHPNGSVLITYPPEKITPVSILISTIQSTTTTTTTTDATTTKEAAKFPDSINAQLPPPAPGEDTRVPYVAASTVAPHASNIKIQDSDVMNSQKRVVEIAQNGKVITSEVENTSHQPKQQNLISSTQSSLNSTSQLPVLEQRKNENTENKNGSYFKSMVTVEFSKQPKNESDVQQTNNRKNENFIGVNTTAQLTQKYNTTDNKMSNDSKKTDSVTVKNVTAAVVILTSYSTDVPILISETHGPNNSSSEQSNSSSKAIVLKKRAPNVQDNNKSAEREDSNMPSTTVITHSINKTEPPTSTAAETEQKNKKNDPTQRTITVYTPYIPNIDTYNAHHHHTYTNHEEVIETTEPQTDTKPTNDHLMDVVHYATYHTHLLGYDHIEDGD